MNDETDKPFSAGPSTSRRDEAADQAAPAASQPHQLMKLYVPLNVHREEGMVVYEDAPLVRFHTRPDAIVAALELVATFQRLQRPVEVYVQDEAGAWHLVSGHGRINAS